MSKFKKPNRNQILEILTECTNMGLWELVIEGSSHTIHMDGHTRAVWGVPNEEKTMDFFKALELFHEDDRLRIQADIQEMILNPGTKKLIEYRVWSNEAKQWHWVRSLAVSRETHTQGLSYIVGNAQDIQSSLAFESFIDQMNEANERTKIMLDATPLCCNFWDENFNNIDCNAEAVKLFDLENKQEYLDRFFELSPEYQPCGRLSSEMALENVTKAFNEGKAVFEWMHQKLDGTLIPSEITLVRVKHSEGYIVTGYTRDLREYRKMMREIEHQDALLHTVNEIAALLLQSETDEFEGAVWKCMGMMAAAADVDRVYIWKNHLENDQLYMTQVYEWSEGADPQQGNEYTISVPYSENAPGVEETLSSGKCVNNIVSEKPEWQAHLSPQGILSILMVPVFLRDQFWGFVGFDDCHRERIFTNEEESILRSASLLIAHALLRNEMTLSIRAAVEEAQAASMAKSNFLSNMSHEMRTPMNAIIGMTSIGKTASEIDRKDYAFEKIEAASKHLLGVINDILDMSKIEANKFELSVAEFDFEKMLRQVVNVTNFRVDEKQQHFSVRIDREIPHTLIGDDQRLAQVITNLLSNAVKFTPEQGSISLNTYLIKKDRDLCTIKVEVKDTGIGIARDQQESLFEAFQQAESSTVRKFGGTGLGLAISKNIIEMMGGKLWVESELGKGSTFAFTISAKISMEEKRQIVKQNVDWENIHILVVDDDPDVLEYFKEIAHGSGIPCDTALNGKDALRLIEETGSYDIYLVDWKMPGMDGIELTRNIKSKHENQDKPIVIMISGMDVDVIRKEAMEAGVDKFLQKPLFPSDIMACISEYIEICRAADLEETPEASDDFEEYHILIAEDVEVNREIVIALLEPTGIAIECAEDGETAVRLFKENPEKFDMIFMDVQMPVMDGYEATRTIRAVNNPRARQIPIIAMTANVFKEDIEKCLDVGMNDHIGKPLDIENLLAKIRAFLPLSKSK